jgi:hypothetical protein
MFQNENIVSMSVVITAREAGSANADIAPLHVVHFQPSIKSAPPPPEIHGEELF